MNFPFTKYSKFYYAISGVLIIGAIASLIVFGLKFGIEFTGGSTMEVDFTNQRPANEVIIKSLASFSPIKFAIMPPLEKLQCNLPEIRVRFCN